MLQQDCVNYREYTIDNFQKLDEKMDYFLNEFRGAVERKKYVGRD